MKLARLESTTQRHSQEAVERVGHAEAQRVRRVEAMEGVEGDRERSLQQEIAEIEAKAIGSFDGAEQIVEDARRVAEQLASLGDNARGLLRLNGLQQRVARVDDEA